MLGFQELPSEPGIPAQNAVAKNVKQGSLFVAVTAALCVLFLTLTLSITNVIVTSGTVKASSDDDLQVQVTIRFGLYRYCAEDTAGGTSARSCEALTEDSVASGTWSDLVRTRGLTVAATSLAGLAAITAGMTWNAARSMHASAPDLRRLSTATNCMFVLALVAASLSIGAASGLGDLMSDLTPVGSLAISASSTRYGPLGDLVFASVGLLVAAAVAAAWSWRSLRGALSPSAPPAAWQAPNGHAQQGFMQPGQGAMQHGGAHSQAQYGVAQPHASWAPQAGASHSQGSGPIGQPQHYNAGYMPPMQGGAPMGQPGQYNAGYTPPAQQPQPQSSGPMTRSTQFNAGYVSPAQPQGGGPAMQPSQSYTGMPAYGAVQAPASAGDRDRSGSMQSTPSQRGAGADAATVSVGASDSASVQ